MFMKITRYAGNLFKVTVSSCWYTLPHIIIFIRLIWIDVLEALQQLRQPESIDNCKYLM